MTTESTRLSSTRAYHASGVGHCNGAVVLHDALVRQNISRADSTWITLQNVLGLAAENTLKAYLSSHGVPKSELQSKKHFGHNLRSMHEAAMQRGLREDGQRIQQPELADVIERFVVLCGDNYLGFNYRYLEGEAFCILSAGEATLTVIQGLRYVLDIVENSAEWGRPKV